MKPIKIFTLLLLSSIVLFSSCSKDEEDNDNQETSQFFTYDDTKYDVSAGAAEISIATGIGGNPNVVSTITLVFLDGVFFENGIEYISTSTTHGLYIDIDVLDLKAEKIADLKLENKTFNLEEGGIFTNVLSWEEKFVSNNIEFGFPDETEEYGIDYDGSSSITFNSISIDEVNNTMLIDISYVLDLENNKSVIGDYKSELPYIAE